MNLITSSAGRMVIRETVPRGIDPDRIELISAKIHGGESLDLSTITTTTGLDGNSQPYIEFVIDPDHYPAGVRPDQVAFDFKIRVNSSGIAATLGWLDFDSNYQGCPRNLVLSSDPRSSVSYYRLNDDNNWQFDRRSICRPAV